MVVQKKVPSVEALERLHRLAYSVPDEVQVRSLDGAIAIDAKSSMGLFALDFSQPVSSPTPRRCWPSWSAGESAAPGFALPGTG